MACDCNSDDDFIDPLTAFLEGLGDGIADALPD
jgi:hypothetical protein